MTPAEQYAARQDAFSGQVARRRARAPADSWAGSLAERATETPHRVLDGNLQALAAYIEPDDVVIDVGGGAGRIGLPLALRCREVINVDPSPAMRLAFERSASEADITNVRCLGSPWPADTTVTGDVVLTAQVTYFVRDIVPFARALDAAARRRVVIALWSLPPPLLAARAYELVYGEPQEAPPGYRELLPVLWDLGILPEVRVLPEAKCTTWLWPRQPTRQLMVDHAARTLLPPPGLDETQVRTLIESHFDALFDHDGDGYTARWPLSSKVRAMLITWETRR